MGACSAEGERAARDPFLGKNRLGLKLETKVGTRFPRAFLDDFQEFGRFSAIFIFYFRLSIPLNGAENG